MASFAANFANFIIPDSAVDSSNIYLLDPEDDGSAKNKYNKLKTPNSRRVDWQVLVNRLQKETGCTRKEIANKTGIAESSLNMIAQSCDHWKPGDAAIELIALYLRNTDKDLPLIGDYYEDIEIENDRTK